MRFLYIDRLLEVDKGKRLRGEKSFSLSEAYLKGHFSRRPIVPGVILLEAMAQIAGWLVVYSYDFRKTCVISLMEGVELPSALRPGATVELCGEMVDTNERASLCRAWIEREGRVIARGERFIFPHFPSADPEELKERFRRWGWLDDIRSRAPRSGERE